MFVKFWEDGRGKCSFFGKFGKVGLFAKTLVKFDRASSDWYHKTVIVRAFSHFICTVISLLDIILLQFCYFGAIFVLAIFVY